MTGPDGKSGPDAEVIQAWSDLADRVCAKFPGYVVLGYCPGITLVKPDPSGQQWVVDRFTISAEASFALLGEKR